MNLSSCRDLKAEILNRVYQTPKNVIPLRSYKVRKAPTTKTKTVQATEQTPMAAIGVAPYRKRDYKLAVRVFRGFETQISRLLRGLSRHEGEMDLATGVRYTPRLTVKAGGSCGHYKIGAGTLGGFVEDSNHYYMLSNNHVFANSNSCFNGDIIVQPGPIDITSGFKVIGHLDRWYPLSKQDRHGIDAALVQFSDQVDFFEPWEYSGIGQIQKTPVTNRFSTTRVTKRGRTTGVTHGVVSAFELDGVSIDYGTPTDPAIVTFDNQIEFIGDPPQQAFSDRGDSGSFIIDRDTMKVYALLYGGGPDAQGIDRTLAHFMPDVFQEFNVRLVQ